jgi:hypothetical protein
MLEDHKICYFTVDLPKNPIRAGIDWPTASIGNSLVARHGKEVLTDEMSEIFSQCGLVPDAVLLWTWNARTDGSDHYTIHSDGHYTMHNQRNCAMNWLISGASMVEWWSFAGARPVLTSKGNESFSLTEWHYDGTSPNKIAEWDGSHPAVLDIKQPHSVKVLPNASEPRTSVTIRFKQNPPLTEMMLRLNRRILKIC